MINLIEAHGKKLINLKNGKIINSNYEIQVNKEIETDIYNLGSGIYSPLEGFLCKNDFESVINRMELSDGTLWPIPIVLDINFKQKEEIEQKKPKYILIKNSNKKSIALLKIKEIFEYDKEKYIKSIFGTNDIKHPGVKNILKKEKFLIGGEIQTFEENPLSNNFNIGKYYLTPEQTRKKFIEKGWEKIVAFQTRNPPHRSHEYLQKCALQGCDGLFINPVIGEKKTGDFKDEFIIGSYEILIQNYYNQKNTQLGLLPLTMKYAGPKEAVLHAIIRQNFGCSHIIVGRDHAGVGDYYGTYEAQEIFNKIDSNKLKIQVLKYEHAGYCKKCKEVTSNKTCPHSSDDKILISGTKLRDKIKKYEEIPDEFMRKEISNYILENKDQFIN
ncbi:sulfate adenylyltransferase [Candidatus Vampirococcus lugosii]|uniref:sulfate adenylyltransferase n=1 Tax=Candidatus Vampirococcus lugosii TaxID=2789015 RepID=A0ABS5QL05_9BACT|nr:sulfate adenylyltransferase [Candidatus Vampirococcus lugosii]MBS8121463.1 Sulfate adenylyltransferase, dissimilatory-type [Candidatus Vampirococcus lugosii]